MQQPIQEYTAKLSDFGLAKDGPEGDQTHVSTRIMGTYGYAAPEYVMTGGRRGTYPIGYQFLFFWVLFSLKCMKMTC